MRNCLEIDIIQDNRKSIKESKYSISDLNSPKCHVYNGIDVSFFFSNCVLRSRPIRVGLANFGSDLACWFTLNLILPYNMQIIISKL